jgi:glycosyltransferase involved in cell wall biosynthesis
LIGDGPLRSELKQHWAAIHRGPHSVEFLGKQPNPAPYIKVADALVLPSHFEGMPNVVLEAMALKTPVIATRVGGTIELQRDRPTILWAQPQQADSLTQAIVDFALHRQDAQQRVQAASKMIAEHHDVTACVSRIETRLQQACTHGDD